MSNTNMSLRLKETLGIIDKLDEAIPLGIPAPQPIDTYMDDPLASPPAIYQKKEIRTDVPDIENSDLKHDYIEARNATFTIMEMTERALAGALEVAVESQHPKAYDSFNSLVNTMRGISKDLLEYQKIYRDIIDKQKPKVAHITQNNINVANSDDKSIEVSPNKVTVTTSLTDIIKNFNNMENGLVIDNEEQS